MAGSRGGISKGKGKSKSIKSKTNQRKPEAFDSQVDQSQISNKAHETGTSEGKNPKSQTTEKIRYTESELGEFLYIKVEDTYSKAKNLLLLKGYGMEEIERAVLNCGHFHGPLDELMNYILTNSVTFIEQKELKAKGEAFEDIHELYKSMLETLVGLVLHAKPHLKLRRTDAMWLLLVRNWGRINSTTTTSRLLSGNRNTNSILFPSELVFSSSSKKVRVLERINSRPELVSQLRRNIPILVDTVWEEAGAVIQDLENDSGEITQCLDILSSDFLTFMDEECLNLNRWLESRPNDPKTAIIVGLMINIKNLQEKVKDRKEWVQQKVVDSAKRLSKHFLELRILKMEKAEAQYWKDERLWAEKLCKVMLRGADLSMGSVNCEANSIFETIRTTRISNAQIRAETEGLKLSASEYEDNLNEVLNKERRYMKKVSSIEKQTENFREQLDKEAQSVLQLQLDDSQAENETEESESKWRQEIQEKENTLALLAEEARMAEMQMASSRGALVQLGLELNIESQLKKDQHRRLEDEMSRLRLSHQLPNIESVCFLESSVPYESSSCHSKCIFCLDRVVCVVLLPCTHQVLCVRCYEEICNTVDGCCPYCHAKIQQGIKVFG